MAVLQDRVKEIKEDDKWKEKFAEKWNKKPEAKEIPLKENDEKLETKSNKSINSKSKYSQAKSIKSMADTMKDINEKDKLEKPEWNKSVKSSEKLSVEERAAAQLADQVLENAPYLKGIHSKASIRKILEREARAQLLAKDDNKPNPERN